MIIRVAEIPEEGLQIEGPGAFPHPFQDPAWSLDDLSLTVEKDGEAVFVKGTLVAQGPPVLRPLPRAVCGDRHPRGGRAVCPEPPEAGRGGGAGRR